MNKKISLQTAQAFDTNYKIGLVAATDKKGDPHISLLSTLKAQGEDQMIFGKFIVGESKEYLLQNPKVGFLVMTLEKEFWTGRMDYTHASDKGEAYEAYNRTPLFRYNTYFGVDRVYYFDLKELSPGRSLDMPGVIFNSIHVLLARLLCHRKEKSASGLSSWALSLLQKLDTLCFISWHDPEGYPVIAPCIQLQAADRRTLLLSAHPYAEMLRQIPTDARVAVYAANLQFESVLVKGRFSGFQGALASVHIDRIYNPMPPKHGWLLDKGPQRDAAERS